MATMVSFSLMRYLLACHSQAVHTMLGRIHRAASLWITLCKADPRKI